MTLTGEGRWRRRLRQLGLGLVVLAGGLVLGVGMGVLGEIGGPLLAAGLPLGAMAAVAILAYPSLGIMAVYASFPVAFISVVAPVFELELQVVEVAVLFVSGLVILRRLGMGEIPLAWAPEMWFALGLLAAAMASTPGAQDVPTAFKQDALLFGGFLFSLAVLSACRSMIDVRRVVAALLAVGVVMSAYGLRTATELKAQIGGAVVANRLKGVFTHPNDLGAFAAVLLLLGIGMTTGARTFRVRALSLAAVGLSLGALMLTLSRGAWFGTALGAAAMLYLVPEIRRVLLTVGVPLLLVAGLFGAFRSSSPEVQVVRERLGTLTNPLDNPYDDRPSIWREALREVREKPWTGQGPGNFPVVSARAGSVSQAVGALHAHNVLLTVAAETGLPAVAVLIALTIAVGLAVLRTVRRLEDPKDRAVVAGIGCALLIQVGQGIVDFNLRNPVLLMLMWSLVGLVLAAKREAFERWELPR